MEGNTTQEDVKLPPLDFITFITDLITTAHLYLQGFRDPETEEVIVNIGLAKRMIDTIEMLEEKTKGNLTAPEANYLANSLYELRINYVRAVNSQKDQPEQDTPDPEEVNENIDTSDMTESSSEE